MNDTRQSEPAQQKKTQSPIKISRAELPLHCPSDSMSLWNTHPRVYMPIEDSGKAKCPYCGTEYTLSD